MPYGKILVDQLESSTGKVLSTGQVTSELDAIARSLNVADSAVIYSTDTATVLDNVQYIYDPSSQVTWGLPTLDSTGKTIDTVSGSDLTTTGGTGSNSYTLAPALDINKYDSIDSAKDASLTNVNQAETQSYHGGWAATTDGPKGEAVYFRDGTAGTASTIYTGKNGFYDANGDGFSLPLRKEVNAYQFGGYADKTTDDSPAAQAMMDFAKGKRVKVTFPQGQWLFNTEVDISSGTDATYRNLEVECAEESEFYGLDNTVNLFNISGQRRLKWKGGKFKRGNICFNGADGDLTPAYCYFDRVSFDGESTGAIQRCYKSDTSIGVWWTNTTFGTDQAAKQIDIAVEFTGASVNQTNINKFTNCVFINCKRGVLMTDSAYARLGTAFVDCWFEDLDGYAVNAGTNSRAVSFVRTYFESCGSATEAPLLFNNCNVEFDTCNIVATQNYAAAFIEADEGTSITTKGINEYGSLDGRVFVDYLDLNVNQHLHGMKVIDNSAGAPLRTYKELLFSTVALADEQYIDWEVARLSSTILDTQTESTTVANTSHKGVVSKVTETVQLAAQATYYDMATVNIPSPSSSVRFEVECYQTVQDVGHAGRYEENLAHWNGSTWVFTNVTTATTVAGFLFNFVSVDVNNFKIQVQRAGGGATNTPCKIKVTTHQGADNIEGNEARIL